MSKGLERVESHSPPEAESGRSAEELARERMLLDCLGIAGGPSIDRNERQAIRNAVEESHSLDRGSPSRPVVTPETRNEIRQAVRRYNDCR